MKKISNNAKTKYVHLHEWKMEILKRMRKKCGKCLERIENPKSEEGIRWDCRKC